VKVYEALNRICPGLSYLIAKVVGKDIEELTLEDVEKATKELYGEEGSKVVVSAVSKIIGRKQK